MKKAIFAPPVNEFVELYDKLKSSRKVGEYYGVTKNTITAYARQVGYDYNKNIFLIPENIKQDIINRYNTDSSTDLAKEYGISRSAVTKLWHDNQLIGKDRRRYVYDHNYFSCIDTKDKAYFLGWMASDGCVSKRPLNYRSKNSKPIIRLTLDSLDERILYTFCKYIGREYSINTNKRITPKNKEEKLSVTLEVVGDEWADDLEKNNITTQKTYTYEMKELEEDMMPHFLRGYFDGDGHIFCTNNNMGAPSQYEIGISGFIHNLEKIQNYLTKNDISGEIIKDKRNKSSFDFGYLRFFSIESKYRFLRYIYQDIDDLYLPRKKYMYDCFMTAIKNNDSNKEKIYRSLNT